MDDAPRMEYLATSQVLPKPIHTWSSSALSDALTEPLDRKELMRRAAYDARNAQENKDAVSEQAVARFVELPEYRAARTAMWYLDCRSELRTRRALPAALASGKRIAVPYCTVDEQGANKLGLWLLESMDELVVGKWRILEPPRERWGQAGKEVDPAELDIVMVPGVAFSREGGRMGNGQGYYDRLLARVRPDCPLVGLCYECQLFDKLVVSPHDVFMDQVVTELAAYAGRGRR
jgi:5-formyltetrahydrofolate cyclo-ligase